MGCWTQLTTGTATGRQQFGDNATENLACLICTDNQFILVTIISQWNCCSLFHMPWLFPRSFPKGWAIVKQTSRGSLTLGDNRTMWNSKVAELSGASPSVKANNNEYLLLNCVWLCIIICIAGRGMGVEAVEGAPGWLDWKAIIVMGVRLSAKNGSHWDVYADFISLSFHKCLWTVCKVSSCRGVCVHTCTFVHIQAHTEAIGLILENGNKIGTISSQLYFFAFPFFILLLF